MKIAFVFDDGLDAPDGVQQYILTLGAWFVRQGHDVHYLVGQTKRTDIEHVHSLSKNVAVRFNGNALSIPLPASAKAIRELLQKEQFDVLHVQMPYSPQLAGRVIALASKQTAVVGTFHILPYGRIQAMATRLLGWVERKTLARIDKVLAVSDAAQAFAQDTMNITASVWPNAVDIASFTAGKRLPEYNDTNTTIVFLGRLVERKGCMQLLQTLACLNEQDKLSNVRVVIAGTGPQLPSITEYIERNNLGSVVKLAGWIQEAEKPNYLRSADIAVMPSMAGESFGIVLVEAIASGAGMVLGGDNPGYRYVLGDDADALVDPRDTVAFAQKLDDLLHSPALRKKVGARQRKRIADFDVSVIGTGLLKAYRAEIAKRRPLGNNKQYE